MNTKCEPFQGSAFHETVCWNFEHRIQCNKNSPGTVWKCYLNHLLVKNVYHLIETLLWAIPCIWWLELSSPCTWCGFQCFDWQDDDTYRLKYIGIYYLIVLYLLMVDVIWINNQNMPYFFLHMSHFQQKRFCNSEAWYFLSVKYIFVHLNVICFILNIKIDSK